ncbi:MAG: hypothetical protein AAGL68_11220 [Pseudomonadota bacterium]
MTIHFAAVRTTTCSPIARALAKRATSRAANDNGDVVPSNDILKAALRHFGEHGLSAARVARGKAQEAFFAGDRQAYDWWLGVTRTLDRRLAATLEEQSDALPS